jgi:hypothetical protein
MALKRRFGYLIVKVFLSVWSMQSFCCCALACLCFVQSSLTPSLTHSLATCSSLLHSLLSFESSIMVCWLYSVVCLTAAVLVLVHCAGLTHLLTHSLTCLLLMCVSNRSDFFSSRTSKARPGSQSGTYRLLMTVSE